MSREETGNRRQASGDRCQETGGRVETLLEMLNALPKEPEGAAGVALALANAIHSCNHVVKVHGGQVGAGASEAGNDRARLVTALVNLSNREDLS